MRLLAIIKKEFRQIWRDKRSLAVLLVIPSVLLMLFGYALNFDVKHLKLAVYDADKSAESRKLIQTFINSEYFDLVYNLENPNEIDHLMGQERIQLALVIPADFSGRILRGEVARVQTIIDGANSNTATTAAGYVDAAIQFYGERIQLKMLRQADPLLHFQPRIWFNPELKSVKFLVPGLIALILMITTVISTALSIVREKERNTMEQIVVSPLKPVELILGKTIPYVLISFLAAMIILGVGYVLFDVTVQGSYVLLFVATLIFIFAGLGWGLFISTIADSQQVAFMIATITTLLPTFVLSGFVFPIRNMPAIVQAVTYVVPARYYLVALRDIMLKGVGLASFGEQLVFLALFAGITLAISSKKLSSTF
ncbi:MAG: ABC transporter permease [Gemmatimonadetes bacterium]|nr:MAG: ABC transporter permease [Gemmatimonadota bacterium]